MMKLKRDWIGVCLILTAALVMGGQRGGPGGARGGGGAGGQRPAPTNFPAQQRTPGPQELVARGNTLYGIHCRTCHGVDLRGGEQGGINLLRSAVVLNDQSGELIFPVVRDGLRNAGMPPMPAVGLNQDDVKAIAEYIHSIAATAQRQGGPPPGPPVPLNLLAGDAAAGKAYFDAKCASCHSAAGDLRDIGGRIDSVMQLQNTWLAGGGRGNASPITVTVTLQGGQKAEGELDRIDDFLVSVRQADGSTRSFRRDGDSPRVEIRDPRDPHRNLLPEYTDQDIHNVTAYLVTLK